MNVTPEAAQIIRDHVRNMIRDLNDLPNVFEGDGGTEPLSNDTLPRDVLHREVGEHVIQTLALLSSQERVWQVNSVEALSDLPARPHETAYVSRCAGDDVYGWYWMNPNHEWIAGRGDEEDEVSV